MAFGNNPTTGTQSTLPANQFPISSVAVPGTANGDLTALEGGPINTDANGNKTSPVSLYVKDGGNVAQGTTTDAAYSGSGAGSEIALLKKLVALLSTAISISGTVTANAGTNTSTASLALESGHLATIDTSTAASKIDLDTLVTNTTALATHTDVSTLHTDITTTNSDLATINTTLGTLGTQTTLAATKTDLDAINSAIGTQADIAYVSGNGTEIALLKKIVAELAATLAISGTVSVSNLPGTQPVSGTFWQATQPVSNVSLPLPTGASTSAKQPTLGIAGTASSDVLSIQGITSMTPLKTDGSGVTQPVSGTVTANAGTNMSTASLALESGNLATLVAQTTGLATTANQSTGNTNTSAISTTTGATTDVAVVGDNNGSISAKLRGLTKIFNDVWDSVNHRIHVNVDNGNANGQAVMANSAPVVLPSDQIIATNVSQVLGVALSVSNPNFFETSIQNAVRNGKAFTASYRNTTGSSILVGLSVFNGSGSGKNILIYNVSFGLGASGSISGNMIQLTTSDAALGTLVTPSNNKAGGAASVATCSATNTVVTAAGTLFKAYLALSSTPQEVLNNGTCILLPSGSNSGAVMYVTAATTSWGINISYIEY